MENGEQMATGLLAGSNNNRDPEWPEIRSSLYVYRNVYI